MYVYLYIHNKYTQNTHTYIMQTKTFILYAINRLTALIYMYVYVYISAGQQLIAINHIQNKSFCVHNMCVYCVYLLCIYKYTHMTWMYTFKKNTLCLYIKYIYIKK